MVDKVPTVPGVSRSLGRSYTLVPGTTDTYVEDITTIVGSEVVVGGKKRHILSPALQGRANAEVLASAVGSIAALTIAAIAPSAGTIGKNYLYMPQVSGGTPPYTYTYTADSLGGLVSSTSTGALSGVFTGLGRFPNIRLRVEDSGNPKQIVDFPAFSLVVGDELNLSSSIYQVTKPADEESFINFIGLIAGERVENQTPVNGSISLAGGGLGLVRGATPSVPGSITYTWTTNLGRSFTRALTATSDVSAPVLTVPVAITVLEGTPWSLQVTTDDPNAEVSLLQEDDAEFFTFTGGLLSLPGLDFEAPLDDQSVDGSNTYRAPLQIKDAAGNTAVQRITVTISNDPETAAPVNSVAPTITGSPVVGQELSGTNGTWTVPAAPSTYTLDTIATPAALVLTLRKSKAAYTGPLVKIRRSSDNATQDFGFTSDGILDMASIQAFVGNTASSAGYIETWYDQSGNGRHATQTVQASQPQIMNAGAFLLNNGRPQINFPNNASLSIPVLDAGQAPRSFRMVGQKRSSSNCDFIKSSVNGGAHIRLGATTNPLQLLKQGSSVIGATTETATLQVVSTMAVDIDATTFSLNIDGGAPLTGTHALPLTPGGTLLLGGSSTVSVYLQSVTIFNALLPANDSDAIQASQKTFYATA